MRRRPDGLPAPFLIYSRLTWLAGVGWFVSMMISPAVAAGGAALGMAALALFAVFYAAVPPVPWPINAVILAGGLISAVESGTSTGETAAEGFAVAAYLLAVVASRRPRAA